MRRSVKPKFSFFSTSVFSAVIRKVTRNQKFWMVLITSVCSPPCQVGLCALGCGPKDYPSFQCILHSSFGAIRITLGLKHICALVCRTRRFIPIVVIFRLSFFVLFLLLAFLFLVSMPSFTSVFYPSVTSSESRVVNKPQKNF